VRAIKLDDVSSRPKAATCRRTPNAFGLKAANNSGMHGRIARPIQKPGSGRKPWTVAGGRGGFGGGGGING